MSWTVVTTFVSYVLSLAHLMSAQEVVSMEEHVESICNWDVFNATCPPNAVILMTQARYGRMRIGPCMERDYYIGCHANVIKEADERCSGRRQCTISVPDSRLHEVQPCPNDLGTYLEAAYKCIEVHTESRESCHSSRPIVVNATSGYLASIVTMETGFGSSQCPWQLQVLPGQHINITLYDFGARKNQEQKDGTYCPVYAKIKEPGETDYRKATVCGDTMREKRVYTSIGSQLDISIEVTSARETNQHFMFKYEAVGCPTPSPPVGGWVQRDGDTVVVGCNKTSKKWHLVCQDTHWIGHFDHCPESYKGTPDDGAFPFGLVVSIVIGVLLGIVIGVTLLGIVLACRRRRQRREHDNALMFHRPYVPGTHDSGYGGSGVQKWAPGAHGAQYSSYAHIWELKQNPGQQSTEYRDPPRGVGDNRPTVRSADGVTSAALSRCQSKNGKEHIYESPKFERKESCDSYTDPPFYHEFDGNTPPVEGQAGGNALTNQNFGTRVQRHALDDSRYSS